MSTKLVVGLDGHGSGERALEYAKRLQALIGDCELHVVYVIEWSPYSFQTAEENAVRHKRREEETATAMQRVVNPALATLKEDGARATGVVRHGNVVDTLNSVCHEIRADQLIICRSSQGGGLSARVFGSTTANLVMSSPIPVTVVS